MSPDPYKAWALFTSDPPDFIVMFGVVIVAVAVFVWWFRGYLAKEHITTMAARLELAHDRQEAVTAEIKKLEPLAQKSILEIAEVKIEVARMKAELPELVKAVLPQLDNIANTSAVVASTVHTLQAANLTVGAALSGSGGLSASSDTPLAGC